MTNLHPLGHSGAPASGPAAVAPDASGSMEGRIWFAQMLRGVAALLVVYFHLAELYWKDNAFVSQKLNLPPLGLQKPFPWHTHLTAFFGHNRLELGDFGVALFFLISGFVIPFSLAKVGALKFLVRRIFRIYPTYMVSISLSVLVLMINAWVTGSPLGFGVTDFLANATLLRDVWPHPAIDPVNWTLIVEMRFYLLVSLVTLIRPLSDWRLLAGLAVILCPTNLLLQSASGLAGTMAGYIPYLTFMLIGTCFYNLIQSRWSLATFGLMFALLAVCFATETSALSAHNWRVRMLHAYPAAAVVFSLAYYFRARLAPSAFLDFFAQISYPLYVAHSILGFSLMYFFYHLHRLPFLNFLEALAVVMLVSWVVHLFIEVPSNRFGHLLTRNWSLRAALAPAPLRT